MYKVKNFKIPKGESIEHHAKKIEEELNKLSETYKIINVKKLTKEDFSNDLLIIMEEKKND